MKMRFSLLPCDPATDQRDDCRPELHRRRPALQRVAFFRSGEFVAPGEYACAYCGHAIQLSRSWALPRCGSCEAEEFIARAPAGPVDSRHRQLVAA